MRRNLIPTRPIDVLMEDEEKNGKQKAETGSGPPTQLPRPIWSSLMTRMDSKVGLFLTNPPSTGGWRNVIN